MYGFQSYISMPIFRRDGAFFGTLCAIDPRAGETEDAATSIGMFRLFADLIGFHLEAQERLAASEAALLDERQTSELREQFIAVLGHDLRNPLAAIDAGTRLLGKTPPRRQDGRTIVAHIQRQRSAHGRIDRQRARFRAQPPGRRTDPRPKRRRASWSGAGAGRR